MKMESELEYVLTHNYKAGMVAYMASHPESFRELMQLAIASKKTYSWRAAWLLCSCMKKNDGRVKCYIPAIMKSLHEKNDGHQRELLLFSALGHLDLNIKKL